MNNEKLRAPNSTYLTFSVHHPFTTRRVLQAPTVRLPGSLGVHNTARTLTSTTTPSRDITPREPGSTQKVFRVRKRLPAYTMAMLAMTVRQLSWEIC